MTKEELINGLNQDLTENVHVGYWFGYYGLQMIIDALEKHIPKKPTSINHDKDIKIGEAIWKAGTTVYKCPCCGSFISEAYKYCNICGQSIDWKRN
jgi:hypothetical protein